VDFRCRYVIELSESRNWLFVGLYAMSDALSNFDFQGLSSPEKLEVIGRLWDSIPDSHDELPLPDSHREELERRLEVADADPTAAVPWEDVRERLRRKP
jgi:putative addiction module component (TIGR02574 family)